ncbi:MAG: 5'/3'-nucleotidase SurE [Cellvibrionaceae bacterium]
MKNCYLPQTTYHFFQNKIFIFLLTTFVFFTSSVSFATDTTATTRVLLTNDDGIESTELAILATELQKHFDVVISAPRKNQSGSSQATTSRVPLIVEKIFIDDNFFGFGVNGRPADAVTFGLTVLGKEKPFDIVVSGINRGANVGAVSHLSGTVGAAMQAQYLGYASIATSQGSRADTQLTASITVDVLNKMIAEGIPKGTVVSINVPSGQPKGIVVKPMGGSFIGITPFTIISSNEEAHTTTYQNSITLTAPEKEDNDTKAYQEGYVTITPLRFDWTDETRLKELTNWDLSLPEK